MQLPTTKKLQGVILLAVLGMLALTGCAGKAPDKTADPMQSAAHHVLVGNQLLDTGDLDQARAEFETAKSKDPSYAPAHSGLARIYARSGKPEAAREAAQQAIDLGRSEQEKIEANQALLEVLVIGPDEPDLDQVKEQFNKLQDLSRDHPKSLFFMAKAYAKAKKYDQAEKYYEKVAAQDGTLSSEARLEWEKLQDRQRIKTDLRATPEIAELAEVSRAQVTALFNEELQGSDLQQKLEAEQDISFLSPDEMREKNKDSGANLPPDVEEHPLKTDIQIILDLDLRGLQADPQGRFNPEEPMLRADMALALEDLLSMTQGKDNSISRLFMGCASPFSDVQAESYAFNAIMLCVSNNLLPTRHGDRFEPGEPVTGMEALRSITRLKGLVEE